ncbi:NUMOD4 domain-containing protein [Flavobacterium sp.]|uniref:NUMOD4 domain-containing protein n=1 Tax=Flavobacterium sp. TaxID=239 RepID=UPI0026152797|nr:NUMOD4 domain-containing protein [Flavobacterium sp.]
MIRIYPNEEFKEVFLDVPQRMRYAISNKGRIASFTDRIEDGNILKGGTSDGYVTLRYREKVGDKIINRIKFVYKLVAENFIPKTSEDQVHVLHMDFSRDNDDVNNLRWANPAEKLAHYKKSPRVIRAKQNLLEHNIKSDGRKLTVTTVIRIKKMLQNPKGRTRNSMIAKQFGISATHLKRIETGENWGHIKV